MSCAKVCYPALRARGLRQHVRSQLDTSTFCEAKTKFNDPIRQIHPHAHAIGGHAEPSAILRISLPPTTTEQLNKQLTKIAASPSQYSNAAAYKSMINCLPVEVVDSLMNIKNIGAPSAIYLRGLPNCTGGVGLAATPSDGKTPSHSSLVVPFLVLHAISYVTGLQLFGHNLEKHGQILQTIAPVRGKEHESSNEGTGRLHAHCENAADPISQRPEFIGLLSLRSDHANKAETIFIDATRLLSQFSASEVKILRQSVFAWGAAPTRGLTAAAAPLQPIVRGTQDFPLLNLNMTRPWSSTVQGEAVLERLQIYLANPKNYESVRLRPGELLLLNNRRVVHARTPFKALFDGADRWLLRVWLRSELMYGACDAMTTRNVFI